jgi:DNA polymerase-3 subunit epsilon
VKFVRKLHLIRPLVALDVETTGVHHTIDRIVQLGIHKLYPDGTERGWETLINPGIPIPPEVSAIHGIKDEDVKDAKTFCELAPVIAQGLLDCDICAFNGKFDLSFIKEEFRRCNMVPPQFGFLVDASDIFRKFHPRTLSAAVNIYLKRSHEDAHTALADASATLEVLQAQLQEHMELPLTVPELVEYLEKPPDGYIDAQGKLVMRNGEITLNFGKPEVLGQPLKRINRGYLQWMLMGDFSPRVKAAVRAELDRRAQ